VFSFSLDHCAGQPFSTVAIRASERDPVAGSECTHERNAHFVNASHLTNREQSTATTNTLSYFELTSEHHTFSVRRKLRPFRRLLHYQNPLGFKTTLATRHAMQTRDAL